jgi:hypothetical protein
MGCPDPRDASRLSPALLSDEQAICHRPATGEWSAIEVVGHMIDKVGIWTSRVERLLAEERPTLAAYDQDALVREHGYQHADPEELFERLRQKCERFASLIEQVSLSALKRERVHQVLVQLHCVSALYMLWKPALNT